MWFLDDDGGEEDLAVLLEVIKHAASLGVMYVEIVKSDCAVSATCFKRDSDVVQAFVDAMADRKASIFARPM